MSVTVRKRRKTTPPEVRFWAKVNKTEGCWLWTGAKINTGYGWFRWESDTLAHRVAYIWAKGPIPDGLQIDHLCRDRACVNPDHLEAVTPQVNSLRGNSPAAIHARKTACPKGHPYSRDYRGRRYCRECKNAARRVGRSPTCKNGHVRAEVGEFDQPGGHRRCVACFRAQQERTNAKRRAVSR